MLHRKSSKGSAVEHHSSQRLQDGSELEAFFFGVFKASAKDTSLGEWCLVLSRSSDPVLFIWCHGPVYFSQVLK